MFNKIIQWLISLFKKEETHSEESYEQTEEAPDETEEHNIEQNEPIIQMNNYSNIMIHVDNGHASSTPGKRSPYALHKVPPELDFYEYKFNREIASLLKSKLEEKGFKVNMVCQEVNEDVKLTTRAERANAAKKNNANMKHLFVSIHANAFGNGKEWNSARGWSAYTTKGQNNSDKFADCLYDAAEKILPQYGMTIRTNKAPDGDRDYEENFTVIYKANMPAVLTENLFFTNIEDTKFLMSDEGKNAIAEIHLQGIMSYSDKYLAK